MSDGVLEMSVGATSLIRTMTYQFLVGLWSALGRLHGRVMMCVSVYTYACMFVCDVAGCGEYAVLCFSGVCMCLFHWIMYVSFC